MADKTTLYTLKANDYLFSVSNEDIGQADIIQVRPGEYHLVRNRQSIKARILSADDDGKRITVEVDGENFSVEIKGELEQQLDQMGFSRASTKHISEVRAPMPGLVLSIDVTEGQELKEGERVLILGAMKMENSILIHANARIQKINVKAGQAVDKGQVLVTLE